MPTLRPIKSKTTSGSTGARVTSTSMTKDWKRTIQEKSLPDDVVNMVIDAYFAGKKDGFESAMSKDDKILTKVFKENLTNAMTLSASLVKIVDKTFSIKVKSAYLKIESKSTFKVILIVPVNFFLSEKRRALTDLLLNYELENNTEIIDIDYSVIPNKKSLNLEKLYLDGFSFHYANNKRNKKA